MTHFLLLTIAFLAIAIGSTAFLCGFHYAVRERDENAPTYGGLPR